MCKSNTADKAPHNINEVYLLLLRMREGLGSFADRQDVVEKFLARDLFDRIQQRYTRPKYFPEFYAYMDWGNDTARIPLDRLGITPELSQMLHQSKVREAMRSNHRIDVADGHVVLDLSSMRIFGPVRNDFR